MTDVNLPQNVCCPCSQGSIDVTGCRFSLYPMSDSFVEIILNAVKQVNASKVWSATDRLSSIYRGKQIHVVDCVQAAFTYAAQTDEHLVGEFTFSRGCPGDTDADSFLSQDDIAMNRTVTELGNFPVEAKISFYAFGNDRYMDHIATIVQLAKQYQLNPQKAHYVTFLSGTANNLFDYFNAALSYAHQHLSHYVLEATLSINSPSNKATVGEQK